MFTEGDGKGMVEGWTDVDSSYIFYSIRVKCKKKDLKILKKKLAETNVIYESFQKHTFFLLKLDLFNIKIKHFFGFNTLLRTL